MRSDEEAERALALGAAPDRVWVTGNTKFDALVLDGAQGKEQALRAEMGLAGAAPVFMAGSTHEGEEELLLGVYKELARALPASPARRGAPLRRALAGRSWRSPRRRASPCASAAAAPPRATRHVTILDTIGELAIAYRLATLVFVGGSFVTRGGQNVLEPAAQGKPVLFGPHMENFKDSRAGAAGARRDPGRRRPTSSSRSPRSCSPGRIRSRSSGRSRAGR